MEIYSPEHWKNPTKLEDVPAMDGIFRLQRLGKYLPGLSGFVDVFKTAASL